MTGRDNQEYTPVDWSTFPILGSQVKDLDQRVGEKGLSIGVREALAAKGLFVKSAFETEDTKFALLSEPNLVIGLHPHRDADAFSIIAGLPARPDIFFVGSAEYLGFPSNITEHLIPIHGVSRQPTNSLRLKWWRKYGTSPKPLPAWEAANYNMDSLFLAAQRVNEGNIVLIFPDGSGQGDEKWYEGVGVITKKILNKKANIIFAYPDGTSVWDQWRVMPPVRAILPPSTATVTFSHPYSVMEFKTGRRGQITDKIHEEYEQFKRKVSQA